MTQLPDKSRVMRKLSPSNEWGWEETLLNGVSHRLDIIAWQLSGDSSKPVPEVWLPSFIPKPKNTPVASDSVSMDITDLQAFLNKPRKSDIVKPNE